MNINFSSISNYTLPLLQENIFSSLSAIQKKTLVVALVAFSCLASCYIILRRYHFKFREDPKPLGDKHKPIIENYLNKRREQGELNNDLLQGEKRRVNHNRQLERRLSEENVLQPVLHTTPLETIPLRYMGSGKSNKAAPRNSTSHEDVLEEIYCSPSDLKNIIPMIESINANQVTIIGKKLIAVILDRLEVNNKLEIQVAFTLDEEGEMESVVYSNARKEFEKYALPLIEKYLTMTFKHGQRFLTFGYKESLARHEGIIADITNLTNLPFNEIGKFSETMTFMLSLNKESTRQQYKLVFNLTGINLKGDIIYKESFILDDLYSRP